MAAPAHPRGLGLPRSAGVDYGAAVHFALPRQALQFWLPRLPESRGSSGNLEIIEAGRDWRAAYRRVHDGSRGQCERSGVSSRGLHVLFRGGCDRKRRVNTPRSQTMNLQDGRTEHAHNYGFEERTPRAYFFRTKARKVANPAQSNTIVLGSGVAAPGPGTMNSCP